MRRATSLASTAALVALLAACGDVDTTPDGAPRRDGGGDADARPALDVPPSDAPLDAPALDASDAQQPPRPDAASPQPDALSPRPDAAPDGPPPPDPCARATLGDGWYCGESLGGDRDARYRCAGGRTMTREACAFGCLVQPPGQPDICAPDPTSDGYFLPLRCGATASVTQGNMSAFSHNAEASYAFDFGLPRGTPMVAMRAGTVSMIRNDIRPGDPCWSGGGSSCANRVNYVLLRHADGTDTLYLHLDEARVTVGQVVARGEMIALSGGTGWSTGPHAHVQRQMRCASWWCQSVALSFRDFATRGGVPVTGDSVRSGNCP